MRALTQHKLKQIRVIYGVALTVLAATILSASFLLQYAIENNSNDSHIVNLSGRQRMLSQRLTKSVLAFERDPLLVLQPERFKELIESFSDWTAVHEGLQKGDRKLGLPARPLSPEVSELFVQIQPYYSEMAESIERLIQQVEQHGEISSSPLESIAGILLGNEPSFLILMERITQRFEEEGQARVAFVQQVARMLLLAGLCVLLLEFIFVFRRSMGQLLRMMSALEESNAALQLRDTVFDNTLEGIFITDLDQRIVNINKSFTRLTGYSAADAIGKSPSILKSGVHPPEFYQGIWDSLTKTGQWRGEIWNRRKSGEIYPEILNISAVKDGNGAINHYVAVFSDITDIKDVQTRLEKQAHFDALTDLPNRILLADRMRQAMADARRRGETLAICLMDLDGFKPINDTHGHEAGDFLLREMAQRLRKTIRSGDTAARLGGDEFVILLGGLKNDDECEEALTRVLDVIAQPSVFAGKSLNVSASIGVTLFPADGVEEDLLLRHADQAMYLAKQAGKNRFQLFDPAHEHRQAANIDMLHQMERALTDNEFCLYFQPIVNCRKLQIVGAEALIRWQHPVLGLLSPAEFLPLIEKTPELAAKLGDWVLAGAMEHLRRSECQDPDFELNINLSAAPLHQKGFLKKLDDALSAYPESLRKRLKIEVIETVAIEDVAIVRQLIETCHRLGVRIALDDFGTGYSSLLHLKLLLPDVLKIDKSFVADLHTSALDRALVDGVIGLSDAFSCDLVAEGVENETQILTLLELGCSVMQGYVFSKPLPPAEFADWCTTFTPNPAWQRIESKRAKS